MVGASCLVCPFPAVVPVAGSAVSAAGFSPSELSRVASGRAWFPSWGSGITGEAPSVGPDRVSFVAVVPVSARLSVVR